MIRVDACSAPFAWNVLVRSAPPLRPDMIFGKDNGRRPGAVTDLSQMIERANEKAAAWEPGLRVEGQFPCLGLKSI
jgi:hypothetical protein